VREEIEKTLEFLEPIIDEAGVSSAVREGIVADGKADRRGIIFVC